MSPGTSSSAGISWRSPARVTMACGDSMLRMASSASSARPSWMKPITALMITTPKITPESSQWPSRAVITPAASST